MHLKSKDFLQDKEEYHLAYSHLSEERKVEIVRLAKELRKSKPLL